MNFFNNIIKKESSANINEKGDFKKYRSSKLLNGLYYKYIKLIYYGNNKKTIKIIK